MVQVSKVGGTWHRPDSPLTAVCSIVDADGRSCLASLRGLLLWVGCSGLWVPCVVVGKSALYERASLSFRMCSLIFIKGNSSKAKAQRQSSTVVKQRAQTPVGMSEVGHMWLLNWIWRRADVARHGSRFRVAALVVFPCH